MCIHTEKLSIDCCFYILTFQNLGYTILSLSVFKYLITVQRKADFVVSIRKTVSERYKVWSAGNWTTSSTKAKV